LNERMIDVAIGVQLCHNLSRLIWPVFANQPPRRFLPVFVSLNQKFECLSSNTGGAVELGARQSSSSRQENFRDS
jgi:hypothetical protein